MMHPKIIYFDQLREQADMMNSRNTPPEQNLIEETEIAFRLNLI